MEGVYQKVHKQEFNIISNISQFQLIAFKK